MTERNVSMDTLREHLNDARERLTNEKTEIQKLHPLPDSYARDEYAFAYLRAERMGIKAINHMLSDIAWLPMQIDPRSELMAESRSSMKRWLTSSIGGVPNGEIFGNDFFHALARCGFAYGWDHPAFAQLSVRVGSLFRDLSCLIGLIYYCSWLSEKGVQNLLLSDPLDLSRTAREVVEMLQSPGFFTALQELDKSRAANAATKSEPAASAAPHLHVVTDRLPSASDDHPPQPDPAPV